MQRISNFPSCRGEKKKKKNGRTKAQQLIDRRGSLLLQSSMTWHDKREKVYAPNVNWITFFFFLIEKGRCTTTTFTSSSFFFFFFFPLDDIDFQCLVKRLF